MFNKLLIPLAWAALGLWWSLIVGLPPALGYLCAVGGCILGNLVVSLLFPK